MNRREFLKRSAIVAAGAAALTTVPALAKPLQYKLRPVEFYQKGKWVPGTWEGLKKDTIFRLRELDGSIADEGTEAEVCVALEDAALIEGPGVYCVKGEEFTFIGTDHPLAKRILVYKDGQIVGFVKTVDLKRGLMHRWKQQTDLALPVPSYVPVDEAESFDYLELRPE